MLLFEKSGKFFGLVLAYLSRIHPHLPKFCDDVPNGLAVGPTRRRVEPRRYPRGCGDRFMRSLGAFDA